MMSQRRWYRLDSAERKRLLLAGFNHVRGRGLCARCHFRRTATDTLLDIERPTLSTDELLDEWDDFTKDRPSHTANVKAFAERLGRDYRAMERALLRAGVRARRQDGAA